ncbi:MAG: HEAT repeat domain-containing protein [Xenococcaceae cyanobacterium]
MSGCKDQNNQDHNNVAQLLDDLHEKRNVQTCDGVKPIRSRIAKRLGSLGDPRAIDPLINILSSPDEAVLSRGASGCQAGSKHTYRDALIALSQFGSQAKRAAPRLIEMLLAPDTARFTPTILRTLLEVEPVDSLSMIVPVFVKISGSTPYQVDYLRTLASFGADLQPYSVKLSSALQDIDASSLNGFGKGYLLSILLNSRASELNQEQVNILLWDTEALMSVDVRAFRNTDKKILHRVLSLLEDFEEKFPESEINKVKSWCGPKTSTGAKNSLRGRIFTILLSICTPESLAAVEDYKRKHKITIKCGASSRKCQQELIGTTK